MIKNVLYILLFVFVISCGNSEGELFSNPSSQETGIDFSNALTPNEDANILDYLYFYNGGGVAVGDINGDALPDIFFSGNQVKNKLYLNKGNLTFEDITDIAGVSGNSTWNTGAVMGDVNGDGLIDIYVCAVVGINGFSGFNELYINNGPSTSSGQVTFTESAAKYGLDFDSYSSAAAFLDYDSDGDLDMYLLNHAVHTQESYGKAETRKKRNYQTGDKLLRNDNGKFIDVSEAAGIYGGVNGYGLGVAVSDFNQDGYPDIYVGNDFHEDDYYYLNNGDGTFTECLKEYFGHTSRFSMGNDVADINHDGWPDILSLDMLPENEKVLKSSEGADDVQTQKLRTERFGYHYQYSRNMLFVNRPQAGFTETALLSGVAATDWSWSALFADYDQDGQQDIFISNGIAKRPNDLDYINFVSDKQIQKKINNTKLVDEQALALMPSGAVHNYIFKGSKDLKFENKSKNWISNDTLKSGATAMADLDLDGDLDLIVNNTNQYASLYINKTDTKANFLKLKFNYKQANRLGIGTKVFSYHSGQLQYKELFTARGFQASSEPIVHFGYGANQQVDSLKIVWPDHTFQVLRKVPTNQILTVTPENTKPFDYRILQPATAKLFERVENNLGISFDHREDGYVDFNRQKLIPYQIGDRGPAFAQGDLNNDGSTDLFFGGSKYIPSKTYIQSDSIFVAYKIPSISKDSLKEDVSAVISDFNSDGKNDILLGTGGADFFNEMKPLLNSYYKQKDTAYELAPLPKNFENASVLRTDDFDNDGDVDIFVGNQSVSNDFGKLPNSYLLENENGNFIISENKVLQNVGMVTDAVWHDFDGDQIKDLIVIGEWMAPTFFKNKNGTLIKKDMATDELAGLWQSIAPFDVDGDGDIDYLLGNWGANSKFTASAKSPMKMYYGDFDNNGQTETIITTEKNGKYYPLESLDGLTGQLVSLKKKFTTYADFAGKTIEEIFEKEILKNTTVLEVSELHSGFLRNENGAFSFVPFKNKLQVSPIMAFLCYDFDKDGKEEALAAGNYFGVKPFHGRFDSFSGALIKDENNVILGDEIGLNLTQKSVRHLSIVMLNKQPYLLVTINNNKAEVYKLTK
ncbi:MAG: VCBS repeat-containing protein [Maribacter sp.]|uniref:VCBS repeat-containing protein n=1 Tax=Maribacter sp. TaxID=1897614 RepID=UPI00329A5CA3